MARGHHSPSRFVSILEKWCDFIEKHQELKAYDVKRILVAKMKPEPRMPNQIMQEDGLILTYSQRIDELISGLKIQHPKYKIEKIIISRTVTLKQIWIIWHVRQIVLRVFTYRFF